MQTPLPSQPFSKSKIGYIIALAGSAIAVLSFLVLPFVTVLGLLSLTLLQIANFANAASSLAPSLGTTSGAYTTQISQAVAFIWLSLVICIIACVIALIFTIRRSSRDIGAAIGLIVLGLIGAGIFLFMIISISSVANSIPSSGSGYPSYPSYPSAGALISIGIGAWLCVIGTAATAVGGILAIVNRPSLVAPNAYGYGSMPQPTQYPPNPYTQYPQQQPPYPDYPVQTPPQQPPQW